jgi:uncharacterized protein (TIGR00255 family)
LKIGDQAGANVSKNVMSMTGFARVRAEAPQGTVTLNFRSVNHRALDLHFHMPGEFDAFEPALRKAIQAKLVRGHVDIRASFQRAAVVGNAAPQTAWNKPLLENWLRAFAEASAEFGLESKPDLNAALRLPGMLLNEAPGDLDGEFEAALLEAAGRALDELNASRAAEGASLVKVLQALLANIRTAAAGIAESRGALAQALHARLQERLTELLGATVIDPARLAQEVALLADRSEIAEEIARLTIHVDALDKLLRAGGEVGKRIDFLLQEMQRETNTILSKSTSGGDAGRRISDLALGVKSDIEKIREQSLNLE